MSLHPIIDGREPGSRSHRSRTAPRRAANKTRRTFRPRPDFLEDRTLLSTVTWTGDAGDNNWDTPANWSSDAVPTASDDVLIDLAGVTVFHSSSAADSVNSLTISSSESALDLSNGSLAMGSPSSIAGVFAMSGGTLSMATSLTVGGSMTWDAGTISGGGGAGDPQRCHAGHGQPSIWWARDAQRRGAPERGYGDPRLAE